jgi:hypothetical protein
VVFRSEVPELESGLVLKRKEVNVMKYEKPQLTAVASATAAIQGSGKGSTPVLDSETTHLSENAYEADE